MLNYKKRDHRVFQNHLVQYSHFLEEYIIARLISDLFNKCVHN